MRFLLLALMFCNIHCMSVQKKGAVACIVDQIEQLESGSSLFSKQREAHATATDVADFQFTFNDEDCKAKITYVKEGSGERVSSISVALEVATSVPALSETFGKFKAMPPTPAGKWSTIARYSTESKTQSYAIIAESRQKITDKSPISKVTIRVDYED